MYNNIYSKLVHKLNMYTSIRWNRTYISIDAYKLYITYFN